VMYKGKIVEQGPKEMIFKKPTHPYTRGLIACRPTLDKSPKRLPTITDFMSDTGEAKAFDHNQLKIQKVQRTITDQNPVILEIKNVKKHFAVEKGMFGNVKAWVKAVDDVSLKVRQGRTLGLVGESGCGKTTLGRAILRLIEPSEGEIFYKGVDLTKLGSDKMRQLRRKMQIIFQDPYASLNPRMTIGSALVEPMNIHSLGANRSEREAMAKKLIERVGLETSMLSRYPHEFSGGQRQRICIARALAVEPEFIVCDESVSALDVSVQAQILNLLLDLQDDYNLSYIFISHDLAVVKYISDEIAVMNKGKIVEMSDAVEIYKNPKDEYTKKLLGAIPKGIPLTESL
jgi:peptide/nickel transport system ATP-binding protein